MDEDSIEIRKAKEQALRFITRRTHSEQELLDKLCRQHSEEAAGAAVSYLRELGYLDDVAFAEGRVYSLLQKDKSVSEIRRKLAALGVSREVTDAALESAEPDDAAAARRVVQRHYARKLAEGKRESVMAALARRGFKHRDIVDAVQQDTGDEIALQDAQDWEEGL